MLKGLIPSALALALLSAAVSDAAEAPALKAPVLKSVSVTLPDPSTMFPGGAEADAVNDNCLACHSAEMVLNQAPQPKATWEAEVHKMIAVYKAPIEDSDVPAIVDYLVRTKGKPGP